MKLRSSLLIIAVLVGCSEQRTYDPVIVGAWQTSTLFIESADIPEGQPGWEYFFATPSNWDRAMNMKPLITKYTAEGTFSAEYRTLKDSLLATATGTWHTVKDSLYYFQWLPDTFAASYQFAVVGDTLKLSGVVDWERDGSRNDKVTMTQLRWPRPDSAVAPPPRRVH